MLVLNFFTTIQQPNPRSSDPLGGEKGRVEIKETIKETKKGQGHKKTKSFNKGGKMDGGKK
jgi:hypothetical protein